MEEGSKYGKEFEQQVNALLAASSADEIRQEVYLLAKNGKLNVTSILVLEEIRRVETLAEQNKG